MAKPKFKYGTFSEYSNLPSKDTNTLYFITDRGLIYKGDTEVTKHIQLDFSHLNDVDSNTNDVGYVTVTDNTTPTNPTSFTIYRKTAVDAAVAVAVANHAAIHGSANAFGHVKLLDDIDSTFSQADGYAATPNAVKTAFDRLASLIGDMSGAMVFKGTIGKAGEYSTTSAYAVGDFCEYGDPQKLYVCNTAISASPGHPWNANEWDEVDRTTNSLPTQSATPKYKAGWTYRVVAPNTYAGKVCEIGDMITAVKDAPTSNPSSSVVNDDWTVLQNNIDGAVITDDTLSRDTIILGSGGKSVKNIENGREDTFLKISSGIPTWFALTNKFQGFSIMDCTASSASSMAVTVPTGFTVKPDGIFAVKFTNAVPASSYLAIGNDSYQIMHMGAALAAGVIKAGDTVTFITKSIPSQTPYGEVDVLSTDRIPSLTSAFDINTSGLLTCNPSSVNMTIDAPTFILKENAVFAVRFAASVPASAKLSINSGTSKYLRHRNANIASNVIMAGDTATFLFDGNYFHLLAIDRPISRSIDLSTNPSTQTYKEDLVTYEAVWNVIAQWETITGS